MAKTIDFKHFKTFLDISQEKTVERDIHKDVADAIYKNMNGIVAHDLALRIYRADGPIELCDEDEQTLRQFVSGTTPIFIDSFEANIKTT